MAESLTSKQKLNTDELRSVLRTIPQWDTAYAKTVLDFLGYVDLTVPPDETSADDVLTELMLALTAEGAPKDAKAKAISRAHAYLNSTVPRGAEKVSAIQGSLSAKTVNPTDCGVPIDKREHQPLPFTHWSKDPLIPYAGCGCRSCADARR